MNQVRRTLLGVVMNGRGEKVGLSGMRERISLLGGKLEFHSEPGRGTTIVAEVDLPEAEEKRKHAS